MFFAKTKKTDTVLQIRWGNILPLLRRISEGIRRRKKFLPNLTLFSQEPPRATQTLKN